MYIYLIVVGPCLKISITFTEGGNYIYPLCMLYQLPFIIILLTYEKIKTNRKAVPCPVIDVVSDDTFEYLTGSELTYGGFDQRFTFDWIPVPERENVRRAHDKSRPLRFVFV